MRHPFQANYKNRRYCYKSPILRAIWFALDMIGNRFSHQHNRYANTHGRLGLLVADHLGDALLVTPIIRQIQKKLPEMEIILLATAYNRKIFNQWEESAQVVEIELPWLDKTRPRQQQIAGIFKLYRALAEHRLSHFIDTRSDFRHIIAAWMAGIPYRAGFTFSGAGFLLTHPAQFSYRPDYIKNYQPTNKLKLLTAFWGETIATDFDPHPFYRFNIKFQAQHYVESQVDKPYLVLQLGGGGPGHVNRFPEHLVMPLLERFQEAFPWYLIIVGLKRESGEILIPPRERILDLRDATDLDQLAALVRHARIALTSSSLVLHLAAAFAVPSITIYSRRDSPLLWHARGPLHWGIMAAGKICSLCETTRCVEESCLTDIRIDSVWNKIIKMMEIIDAPSRT